MAKQTQTDRAPQKAQRICNPVGKRLYTLKEAAFYLGRSEWGMRDLMWKGVIPVVKLRDGRKVFFDVNDLESFVEQNKGAYT